DLAALRAHATAIRAALPAPVELHYAAKANPAAPLLRELSVVVDGFEVASGGELDHVRSAVPSAALAFGGPAKTDTELVAALRAGVHRIHVESVHELRRIGLLAARTGTRAHVLLRVNLPVTTGSVVLGMGGGQFGIAPADVPECLDVIRARETLICHGIHAHLASGLAAADQVEVARATVDWACRNGFTEINVGGGMAVDYTAPEARYDWATLGAGLRDILAAAGDVRLRVEPGRAVSAYCGWYVASVVDVKRAGGEAFAAIAGGTHHLRTPAAKGHDQPFDVLAVPTWDLPWARPAAVAEPVTVVGQLCTPKDVLARRVPVDRLRAGDRVAFGMAGAYAWNISHQDFLMHPRPTFHYLSKRRVACRSEPARHAADSTQ
ncbi:MAG TPA: type III PLP-dependent enzyme, partial [Pseudonocardiaceae bacterium]|nr:type III PLP-dependent enzyme [Pseudonocardiaceae bacterium]